MKAKQVSYHVEKDVLYAVIDNPETKNGLTWEGILQLADCYAYTAEHPEIRAIVITGNDRYFYTGGRVDASVPGESQRYADAIERLTQLQDANKTPMIAAISGDCMKAGMGLAAKCDFAIAREGALFSFPEVRMGGAPMMVMAETIDALPRKKALEAYYSSWNYSAQEMLQAGFLNAVVPADQFDATVEKYLRILLDTPRALIELTRTAYEEMDRAPSLKERRAIALRMLREDVLSTMEHTATSYNV